MEVLLCDRCGDQTAKIYTLCLSSFRRHWDPMVDPDREMRYPRSLCLDKDGGIQEWSGITSFALDLCESCTKVALMNLRDMRMIERVRAERRAG